jgi:hypothetical protein
MEEPPKHALDLAGTIENTAKSVNPLGLAAAWSQGSQSGLQRGIARL